MIKMKFSIVSLKAKIEKHSSFIPVDEDMVALASSNSQSKQGANTLTKREYAVALLSNRHKKKPSA